MGNGNFMIALMVVCFIINVVALVMAMVAGSAFVWFPAIGAVASLYSVASKIQERMA